MTAIKVKDLSFSYSKDQPVLKNVSLEVNSGYYVSLLGHNGSGKSTLAKLIVGLLPFSKGEIYISDIKLCRENISKIRNKVAVVFQNPDNQFIGATVEDDIAFSLENRNVPREEMLVKVKEAASKVGMKEFLSKEPGYLSGGQKQRVAIADALVINPDILVLDEATSMLDPQGKKDIFALIKKMREENPNLTVISITHDVEEANLSDRIVLLSEGEVVGEFKPEELFSNKELVSKYSLEVPFIYKLKNKMKENGYKASSLKEMEDELCR